VRFFLDNDLSLNLARALAALAADKYEVKHLRDKFPADVTDQDWLLTLGREGDWVIVSGDVRITKSRLTRQVWLESGLTAFFLEKGWTGLRFWEQAWRLVRWWPAIMKQAERAKSHAAWLVAVNYSGRFKPVSP